MTRILSALLVCAVVATVMSNLGLERYLAKEKINLTRTPVGDRYVLEEMRRSGCNVGGEQSGHMLLTDFGTSGDALMVALQVLAVLKQQNKPASAALNVFKALPQILNNVRVTSVAVLEKASVKQAIADAEQKLSGNGRILIRKSGTEPVIRVMAEGDDEKEVRALVESLCAVIKNAA